MAKRLLILLAVMAFTLSLSSTYVSAGMGEEIKGSVTKIEDGKVTILDAMGNEKTMKVKNPAALQDLKVGEQVSIKEGMLTKESGESSAPKPSAPAHGPKY
jgi:transcription antitermination factor NusG